jgi:putative serine protease PepD
MTDVLLPSEEPIETHADPSIAQPPLPPPVPGPAAEPKRSGPKFVTGVVIGALVGASVSGGIVSIAGRDDTPATTATPAITVPHNAISSLVAQARPSVVAIHDSIVQTDIFGQTAEGQAAGTGFVLSADGYIVTNDHVVDGATDITVNFGDGTTADATVVAADPNADLAVLKVDRTDLVPLPLGSSAALQVGDQLVAIGNALDLSGEPTVTTGIVSATGRSLTEPNGVRLVNLIQTDTAINPGNSGGPLLNMSGEVVGINTAIAGQAQSIGFAIAIDPAKQMIEELQTGTVPDHALLGVTTQPVPNGGTGAAIVDVNGGSAAADAGLQPGDVITAIDGATVEIPEDLGTIIAEHAPGDKVTVTFERDGQSQSVTATLGIRPATG